jgi:hypothetical protein
LDALRASGTIRAEINSLKVQDMTVNNDESGREPAQARVEYRLPIAIEGDEPDGTPFSERTVVGNVTRGGAFVETARALAPGVLLALHDAEEYDVRLCYVQVVWTRGADEGTPGAGVKIVSDNARWMAYLVAHSVQAIDEDPESTE